MKNFKLFCLLSLMVLFTGCKGESYLEMKADTESLSSNADTSDNEEYLYESENEIGYIQLTGAVLKPGVYEINGETRLFQVIEQAGGLTPEAEPNSVNQAVKVSDGDNIHILTKEEVQSSIEAEGEDGDGKVNINTADMSKLMTLPGIGESKAKIIIEYRDTNGPFMSVEDIMKIPGIKEGVFNKIKDEITVG